MSADWIDWAIAGVIIAAVTMLVLQVGRWAGPLSFYVALALVLIVEAALTLHLLRRHR